MINFEFDFTSSSNSRFRMKMPAFSSVCRREGKGNSLESC